MVNKTQALKCVGQLKEYFEQTESKAEVEYPSHLSKTSKEYLIYIFYSCLLDYGMRSKVYHHNLVNLYKVNNAIFNPQYVVENYKNNTKVLLKIFKENLHPRYPNIAVRKWIELSEFLTTNNIKEKITSLSSHEELYQFITTIKGFGQKTGGLLLRLVAESGICKFADQLTVIPIDRHDIDISYLTKVVSTRKPTAQEIKELSDVWIIAAKQYNLSASTIDQYLWTIGNSLCTKKLCENCPLNNLCKKKM